MQTDTNKKYIKKSKDKIIIPKNYKSSYARRLERKITTKRVVNEKILLKDKKPWQKAFTIVFDVLCVLLVLFMAVVCFSLLNSRSQKTPASLFGYSALKIVSPSMEASGFKVGDCIMVHSVDTRSLSKGDIIAFYSYNSAVDVPIEIQQEQKEPVYTTSFLQIFGFQTSEIKTVAVSGARLTFHEIVGIYENLSGTRYFKTKGTSNEVEDPWYINENHVLGIYVNSSFASGVSSMLNMAGSSWLILFILLIPILGLAFIIIKECIKDAQITKLELDCVEEKRKITDPICVKNKVGFHMDRKTKFKILATAENYEKMEYVNLLWPEDKIPNCVRKYYLKRGYLLRPLEKLRDINRECERRHKAGEDLESIGLYYEKERMKIDKQVKERYEKIMKMK